MQILPKARLAAGLLVMFGGTTLIGGLPAGASVSRGGHTYYVAPSGSDTNPGTVAAPFATIGAALSADNTNYDTIIVEDGTYSGPGNRDLSFGGRSNITVESQNGAAVTTIDCGGSQTSDASGNHRGFYLNSGETNALIKGLTIKNGYESSNVPSGLAGGGGVFVGGNCTVSVVGCNFVNNHAYGSGGGLFTYGMVDIEQCSFTGNSGNTQTSGGDGGALNVNSGGNARAVNCVFTGNTGPAVDNFNALTLLYCTFTQNNGGGVLSFDPATLTDDIFYNDTGTEVYDGGNDITATYCDIQQASGVYPGTGNINADPVFVSPPADLHLQQGEGSSPHSPCVGAGIALSSSAAPYDSVTVDKDNISRASPPSIGAFEGNRGLRVPQDYPTIQAAINAAASGQIILIADGTYSGLGNVNLDCGGKDLRIRSVNGPAVTIINCGGTSRGFYFHSGEGSSSNLATVTGLTIENGSADYGGGAYVTNTPNSGQGVTNVGFTNCVFSGNSATYAGGGACVNSLAGFSNCVFTGNSSSGVGGGVYGGGGNNESDVATLYDCTLTGNQAKNGGGLYSAFAGYVQNCVFTGNIAVRGTATSGNTGLGGAIYTSGVPAGSNYNALNGGLSVLSSSFTGNSASTGGAALYGAASTGAQLTDDIFFRDGGTEIALGANAGVTASYCDIQQASGVFPGTNNINANPLFVNPPSDLHLQPGSPCVGAGGPVYAGTVDKDGVLRPNPSTIGAYEGPKAGTVATSTMLTSSQNPSLAGQAVTFTATVTSGSGIPAGTITFYDGGTFLGMATLNAQGQAGLVTTQLQPGAHSITTRFSGNATFAPSASAALTQTVTAPPAPTLKVSVTVGKAVRNADSSVSVLVTVSNTGTAPATVTLTKATLASSSASLPPAFTLAAGTSQTQSLAFTSVPVGRQRFSVALTATSSLPGQSQPVSTGQYVAVP